MILMRPPVRAGVRKHRPSTSNSPEKTSLTHIADGFDVLGQHIRKYPNGKQHKFLITPSAKSHKTLLLQVRTIVTGDRKHLLPLGVFRGIAIISAADFLALVPEP
ncbi:hypothetical protein [Candidatus Chloroploca asiatica]|uniref:hypothetical protein n=1 Tax=Candidatus Chloroploca asiatica TaxID=1506545 RepID=UPI0011440346|nr:hypothetical protein [Candidatus Chloroploca asiatica]